MSRAALVAGAALAAALLVARPARAEGMDGMYGRFDGDLELRGHAGVAFASGGPAFAASLTAIYLSTAGVYVHYTDALGSAAPAVTRSLSTGIHLAPLFLGRAAVNAERGPPFLDLVLDSLAFELGGFWAAPRGGAWEQRPGLEAALGVAVPILGRATGPFLAVRAALRWRPVVPGPGGGDGDFVAGSPGGAVDRGAVLSLTLGWHHVLRAHIVDAGDGARP